MKNEKPRPNVGGDVCEAFWKFFIDAGGFPRTIQCDFDPRLIGGRAAALLRSHGTTIRAAPPDRQDYNGLVERKWQSITAMARSFLAEAKLPKKFWFWAIREAAIRSNMLPISQHNTDKDNPKFWSTPHFEFCGFFLSVRSAHFVVSMMVIRLVPNILRKVCWELPLIVANLPTV